MGDHYDQKENHLQFLRKNDRAHYIFFLSIKDLNYSTLLLTLLSTLLGENQQLFDKSNGQRKKRKLAKVGSRCQN